MLNKATAVIGDLVGSRRSGDRRALHAELLNALNVANGNSTCAEPLVPTVGDEFQGVFHRAVDALRATLLVRASMTPEHDVRFGLGVGPVQRLGDSGFQQDGPGWWAARDAIDYVGSAAGSRNAPKALRSALFVADGGSRPDGSLFASIPPPFEDPEVRAVNAYLVTRDHVLARMDARDRRILLGLLLGVSVTAIAEQEDVSPSAVSQRSQRSGAAALVYALETWL